QTRQLAEIGSFCTAAEARLTSVAAVSPDAERIVAHQGFKYLAPRFYHREKRLWVAPMMLDMSSEPRHTGSESHNWPHVARNSEQLGDLIIGSGEVAHV
ncbi:MAG: hypothetical protein AAGC55_11425, partial [Myxococcota bacterium]